MKVKGTDRVTTSRIKRAKSASSADKAAFGKALNTEETQASSAMSGTAPITSVNSLLSLQEMPTATDGKTKAIQRAEGLIEHLEAIRHGLLLGQISKKRLTDIVKALAIQREKNLDPHLVQIINDIELRAKVELAKLDMLK
ncbi:MAG: flagellar assembly protein FliX [Emcibacteraceae bacterium]